MGGESLRKRRKTEEMLWENGVMLVEGGEAGLAGSGKVI